MDEKQPGMAIERVRFHGGTVPVRRPHESQVLLRGHGRWLFTDPAIRSWGKVGWREACRVPY